MKNLYASLEQLAKSTVPKKDTSTSEPHTVQKMLIKQAFAKLEEVSATSKKMYPKDKDAGFAYWKKQLDINTLPTEAREVYWESYEKNHPEGKVGAKRDFVDITLKELEMIPGLSQKEFFLRDTITKTPSWASDELAPILGNLSATVVNSNYSKSQQVYTSNLNDRMNSFMQSSQLDPDVPTEVHVQDVVKLEQLNLLDVSKFDNGRIGVYAKDGSFMPSSNLEDRSQLGFTEDFSTPSVEEQALVRNIAPSVIRKAVEISLSTSRGKIVKQEQYGEAVAETYLTRGDFNIDRWNTAFSMLPSMSMSQKIENGIRGEIASGRIKTDAHLAQTIYKAVSLYGQLLPKGAE